MLILFIFLFTPLLLPTFCLPIRGKGKLEAIRDHKGGHTCGWTDEGVCTFHPGKMWAPVWGMRRRDTVQGWLQVWVGLLRLAVSLGMVAQGEAGCCAQGLTETMSRWIRTIDRDRQLEVDVWTYCGHWRNRLPQKSTQRVFSLNNSATLCAHVN